MASVAQVALPAQPISYFPELAPLAQNLTYRAVIDSARAEYNKSFAAYTQAYNELVPTDPETKPLAVTWGERHVELIAQPTDESQKADLNRKIDIYIKNRQVREDLCRILTVYDRAIEYCAPAALEIQTLMVLLKMKAKVADLKASYDQIFTTDLGALKEQRERISELYSKFVQAMPTLSSALEPLAAHCLGYSWTAHQALKFYVQSKTPLVKSLVNARELEIAALLKPAPEEDHKEK